MTCRMGRAGLVLTALLWARPAGAQMESTLELTYERALSLARDQSPVLRVARTRVGEAESEVAQASVWRTNPQVTGAAGPRWTDSGRELDWFVSAQQWLEVGGQRRDRVRAARAGAAGAQARSADASRRTLQRVGMAFVAALYWRERVALAERNARIAERVWRVAEERHALGDSGGLEQSLAAVALVRAQADVDLAQVARVEATGELAMALGVKPGVRLHTLGELGSVARERPAATVLLDDRADLVALRADRRVSTAQSAVARSKRVPDVALAARYGEEEGERLVRGSVTLAVPLFDRGQGDAARAEARERRTEAELTAATRAAAVQVEAARERARVASEAARRFERGGLELLERAERQATASYELGAMPLTELLATRRELVRAHIQHADLQRTAAAARVDLAASTGELR